MGGCRARMMLSGTDETGVEGAGNGDVSGALDEGAAVGKEGEGVGWAFEAEEQVVETDGAVGDEAVAHGGEVYGAMVLVDLYGVAAAEGDVRTAFAGQMREDPVGADGTVGVGCAGVDLTAVVCPEIVR